MGNQRWTIEGWAQKFGVSLPNEREIGELSSGRTAVERVDLEQIYIQKNVAKLALDRFEQSIRKN
ncbi:hypothetical protein [Exiguobacterium acetylicum]|uniref:hypothetical protein n=1 Tax=Exiguobacterium acetylicum TaxID=41170 RepID=UPI001CA7B194|nr:hypothetical protein [Exiguobacterium acetylicum]QZY88622.1 hypothetical protein K7G97_17345 [Exiguobacterium acetylicum]